MKKYLLFALVAALMMVAACSEPLDEAAENEGTSALEATAAVAAKSHWGNKIEDPYSVSNMRLAYKELMKNSGSTLSKAGVVEDDIAPTHLYLKFIPKTFEELRLLDKDTILNVVPVPLTYDLEGFDGVYRDPECPEGQPTYQYAVARINYKLPEVEYVVLDSLFMPFEDDYDQVALSKSTKFESIWKDLELESVKLTGNFTEEDYNPPALSKKYHPSGKVTYVDDVRGEIGVPNVRVHVNFSTHSHNFYTNEDGTFEANGRYTWKVHFHVYFKCPDATVYVNGKGSNNVAGSYGGKATTCNNFNIDNPDKKNYAIIITAAYDYFQKDHEIYKKHTSDLDVLYYGADKYGGDTIQFVNDSQGIRMYYMPLAHSKAYGKAINGFAGIVLEQKTGNLIGNFKLDAPGAFNSNVHKVWREGVEWFISKENYPQAYENRANLFKDLIDDDDSDSHNDQVSGFDIKTISDCTYNVTSWSTLRANLQRQTTTANRRKLDNLIGYWEQQYNY